VTKPVDELAGEIEPFVISHAIRRKAQGVTFVPPGQYRQQADDTIDVAPHRSGQAHGICRKMKQSREAFSCFYRLGDLQSVDQTMRTPESCCFTIPLLTPDQIISSLPDLVGAVSEETGVA
jgi:hypothetical protein